MKVGQGIEDIQTVECPSCSGSGEGQVDWAVCSACRGRGYFLDIDIDDRADRDLDRAEWRAEMEA